MTASRNTQRRKTASRQKSPVRARSAKSSPPPETELETASPAQKRKPAGEKLQKVMAGYGLGSRRELETWIEEGRVSIDGKVATLGDRVLPQQTIRVDGRVLARRQHQPATRVLLYHKPEGELCTRSDPRGRPTVFTHLPRIREGRWLNVGRLDFNTSGLLLFTNNGELANRLMHPRFRLEREYAVRVFGQAEQEQLAQLRKGVELEDGLANFDSITDEGGEGANHWYHVTLSEGRYREVRRMWEAIGLQVSRLIRTRYGPVHLPRRLPRGRWEMLEPEAVHRLMAAVQLKAPVAAPKRSRKQPGKARRPRQGRGRPRHR